MRRATTSGEDCRDAGGERDTEVAADAVERHGPAAMGRALDHHGGADRMIDRGKDAENEQRDGEPDQRRRQRRADQ